MNVSNHPFTSPAGFFRAVREHRGRWLWPAVVVASAVGFYGVIRPNTWEARQALVVRNEAAGNLEGPGKFRGPEDLKVTQETILEIGKSPEVLAAALKRVGPPAGYSDPTAWPTARDVEDFAQDVRFTPPKGAELGKTEVFYAQVKNGNPERAKELAAALSNEMQSRFGDLRNLRAESMIAEMNRSVELAKADLTTSTAKLSEMERSVGGDLAELRNLHELSSGDSDLRQQALAVANELRQAEHAQHNNEELLKVLEAAKSNPDQLLTTPNELLQSQPTLRRLKEGLVDAQLRTAQLSGGLTENHPSYKAAKNAETAVTTDVHNEIDHAIAGLQVEGRLNADRVERLQSKLDGIHDRLAKIAGLRADYSNLVAQVEHSEKLVEEAQRNLTAARAGQTSANSGSLITLLGNPDTGTRPIGMSRAATIVAGVGGGLATGLGVLFLTVPPVPTGSSTGASRTNNLNQPTAGDEPKPSVYPAPDADFGAFSLKRVVAKAKEMNGAAH